MLPFARITDAHFQKSAQWSNIRWLPERRELRQTKGSEICGRVVMHKTHRGWPLRRYWGFESEGFIANREEMEKRPARAAFITHSCVASSLQCLSFIVVSRLINVARCIGDVLHDLSSERIKELSISMLLPLLVTRFPYPFISCWIRGIRSKPTQHFSGSVEFLVTKVDSTDLNLTFIM